MILKRFFFLCSLFFFPCVVMQAAPIKVVASFSILGDLVQQVGGDKVKVTSIVGPNGDAHIYEPVPTDVKNIAHADMLFINGLGFEGWMERLVDSADFKGTVVTTTQGLQPRVLDDPEEGKILDPHIWHDPVLVKQVVQNIINALVKRDPDNKCYYESRGKDYLQKLDQLHQWITSQLKGIPSPYRKVITAHDAFGYFGNRYQIEILSPVGISTEAEPPLSTFKKLIRLIKELGILTIFFENITNTKTIELIANETGAHIGGVLYSDALSTPDAPGATYLSLMRHNVTLFIQAMKEILAQ